jgi:hypothetical protein
VNPFFHLAPRGWLRQRELDPLPESPREETSRAFGALKSLRIAFVKQEVAAAMPNLPGKHDILDFLKSAGSHTGCLSLLHELEAELVLVREDSATECQTWREKVRYDPDPVLLENLYRREAREVPVQTPAGPKTRHDLAIPVSEVDWKKFDLVIALDIPVPEKVVRAYPRTVWAYMITETAMPSYRASRQAPLFGYQLFLNQKCRLHPVRPTNRWHEIDFPWAFQTKDCYAWCTHPGGSGILLDPQTQETPFLRTLAKECRLSLQTPKGQPTPSWIETLRRSRYLVRLTRRRNWGNLLIEAACIGPLVLADPASLENPAPLLRELIARSPAQAAKLVRKLEKDFEVREHFSQAQRARVYELAFARPLRELWQKVKTIRESSRRP